MAVILWATLGLLIAGVAKLVVWEEDRGGWLVVVPVGISGAILGATFRTALFVASDTPGFDLGSMFCAMTGAAFLLWLRHEIVRRAPAAVSEIEVERQRRAA